MESTKPMLNLNLANVLTVAQTEKRLTRRLKRYWLFLLLAYAAGAGIFFYYSVLHALFSSFSATLGTINPHYLLSVYGYVFVMIFTVGIVFTGFDIRARDVRERIVEVLDCRPVSNMELVVGRFFALFQMAWIPLVVFLLLLQLLGWLLPMLGVPIGDTIELDALLTFIFVVSLPGFCFSIALVFLVTLLVRNRVLATVVTIGILVGLFLGLYNLPIATYPFFDNFGSTIAMPFPTDLTSVFSTTEGLIHRLGFLLLSFAFIGFAVAIHPRLDDSNRKHTALVSGIVLAAGLSSLALSSLLLTRGLQNRDWVEAHAAVEGVIAPDIVSVDGDVRIAPGRSLQAVLQLTIEAPASAGLDSVLFSLNPGFSIDAVTDENGSALAVTHENGLLEITLPSTLQAGRRMVLNLEYSGKPDVQFAYLDSRLKYESLSDFNDRGLQGTEPGLFDEQFVALMPGIYWLPLAGSDFSRDDTRETPRDFFNVDLEVEVPADWLVAGPGSREHIGAQTSDLARYRFAPRPPVSEVALVAAEFARYAADISGIQFEILVHPAHTRNFTVLAPMKDEIIAWVENRLALAADAGLAYPFEAFTMVEVPNGLRVYKGGWRMDSALAPPGMMLMYESGFPTSRFDFNMRPNTSNAAFGGVDDQGITVNQESFKTVSFDRLLNFFTSDLSGGNVFMGMSRSYFAHHTAATGPEAIALNFILDMLATLVVSDERYYFSMYNNINATVTNLIETVVGGGAIGQSITQRTINSFIDDVNVWNSALNSSLANIDTTNDPERTINLLTLKGGDLAQAIYDTLGARRAGEFLAALLREHSYSSYTLSDVVELLATYDAGLATLFEETITSAELPGFVSDGTDLYRLPDGPNGEQRYQLLVRVRNDEAVSGFTRVSWVVEGEDAEYYSSEPIRIEGRSAIEFGVVLSEPPASALITPYLSLNRGQFLADVFVDQAEIGRRDAEAFEGVRAIDWDNSSERIIMDDLDSSFVVIDDNGTSSPDRTEDGTGVPLDQGIRINQGNAPQNWNRISSSSAYGHYRHTFVSIMAGEGDKKAILTSEIARAGLYDLEIHIPAAAGFRQNNMKGNWNLSIITANGTESITFDNGDAISGWNLIGSFELPKGEVKIEMNNQVDSIVLVVDALAWTPVNIN